MNLRRLNRKLEDLELNYMKGLFGANVSPEVITKVANGNIDSFSQLQGKVTDMQNRLEAAKKRVEECQKNVDDLTLQSTKDTNNAGVSTKNEELTKDQATTDLTEAQNRFEKDKAATIASLNNQIKNVQADIEDLTTLITNGNTEIGTDSALTTVKNLQTKLKNAKTELDSARAELNSKTSKSFTDNKEAFDWCQTINWSEWGNDAQISIQSFMAAYADYKDIEASISEVSGIEANLVALAKKQDQLAQLQNKLAEVQAITASSDGGVQDAQNRLNQANRNILEITTANSQTSVAWQNRLADANAALKNAQAVYDLLKEEQTSLAADINAELDLSKTNKDIQKKKEEIEKLKEKSRFRVLQSESTGGRNNYYGEKYVAGETTQPEDVMAVIQPEGKGFTLSISVTNEQAKKVQIGDMAELGIFLVL